MAAAAAAPPASAATVFSAFGAAALSGATAGVATELARVPPDPVEPPDAAAGELLLDEREPVDERLQYKETRHAFIGTKSRLVLR